MDDQFALRIKLQNQLIEKAMKDEVFRKTLVTSPKETLEEEFRMKIPEGFDIKVLEENANTFYVVLPAPPNVGNSEELSEAELELVSGGTLGDLYHGAKPDPDFFDQFH